MNLKKKEYLLLYIILLLLFIITTNPNIHIYLAENFRLYHETLKLHTSITKRRTYVHEQGSFVIN